jgi:hypothetical protein
MKALYLYTRYFSLFKLRKGAIPQGGHQILAMEKFEDRPMSPDTLESDIAMV